MTATVAVLGAGAWGTALALALCRRGHAVRLWGHDPAEIAILAADRENRRYLPQIPLPDALAVTADLAVAVEKVDGVLVVVPSHGFVTVMTQLMACLETANAAAVDVAWATKGLHDGQLLHEWVAQHAPAWRPAVISGPSFAREVALNLPTAITAAAADRDHAWRWVERLHGDQLRLYASTDLVGVQLGGAMKNVLAIAVGISDGLGLGANARAALITRGVAEMTRLGLALGAKTETLMGLAGLGDAVLTCTDDQSRNRRFGLALGHGLAPTVAEATIGLVEGRLATPALLALGHRWGVELPVATQVAAVLDGQPLKQAVAQLLSRMPKHDHPLY